MKMIISNSSSVPIYEQIKSSIIEQIMSGVLKENEMLPSIRSLASDIRISVMTIKKAYDELEQDGYIVTVQGKGSFVVPKNIELAKEQARKDIEIFLNKSIKLAQMYNISEQEVLEIFKFLMESDENE
ncbi:MAG: GntR family transcriptional regulator [Bacilli bacterium]|jgi:GntR family transcriptional regulator|nr:GntR family transcriptional regulator [Bacilli bacterium]